MKKPVESYDGYNLPITKETIEALSESIHQLSGIYRYRYGRPDENKTDEGLIIAGIRPLDNDPSNPTSAGLIYFKGEILPFKPGFPQAKFSIVDESQLIEGTDLNGMPYKANVGNKYAVYDASGAYDFNVLVRGEIADRKSLFHTGWLNMPMSYLDSNFTREVPNQARSVFQVDQFGRLINCQILKPTVPFISGNSQDIKLMTLPFEYRPKIREEFDRLYFTAYVKRAGQSPVRTIPYSMYIIPSTGVVYLQTEGNSLNLNETDLIYVNFEYYVR